MKVFMNIISSGKIPVKPLRVDKFLMNFIENATRNKIQKSAKSGNIYVNGETVKQNFKVKLETPCR